MMKTTLVGIIKVMALMLVCETLSLNECVFYPSGNRMTASCVPSVSHSALELYITHVLMEEERAF